MLINSVVAIESNPTDINGEFVGTSVPRIPAMNEMTVTATGSYALVPLLLIFSAAWHAIVLGKLSEDTAQGFPING